MLQKKSYNIMTFGCQMNERDSETLAGFLQQMGYTQTEDPIAAEVVIINTCSVRENADKHFYGVLGQLKHSKEENPEKVVAVCGCMAQQQRIIDNIDKRYSWVDLIFGTLNLHRFPDLFNQVLQQRGKIREIWSDAEPIKEGLPAKREYDFKAYVKIMEGCNNFCSYCIVPYTRGRERSRNPQEILKEINCLAKAGTKEIMLLGQNVNSYDGGISFAQLLKEIDKVPGIERIRFMTSHPKDLSDELVQCFAECKHLCKYFHLPVQSGSNAVLRRMNRKYTREQYLAKVAALRAVCPDIVLTTDIIVAFPGETEEDFQDTLSLVEQVRYDSAFTFIYSKREGTPAAKWEDQIPQEIAHDRFNRLVELVHRIQEEDSARYQDKILPVLIEGPSKTDKNVLTGRTDGLKTVDLCGPAELVGQIVPVRITKAQTFSLYGELAEK